VTDLAEKEKTVRAAAGGVFSRVWRHAAAWTLVGCTLGVFYAMYVLAGSRTSARTGGILTGMRVHAPVRIVRDGRGIVHIRAANEHDAFFAEGFAQGSDRLFQMDLFRRYIYGQLAEIVGPIQLPSDQAIRVLDVRHIVQRQWKHLRPSNRQALQAFSDGVNAAIRTQPLPIEFRLLLYSPEPWKPQDCLAVTLAMSVSLEDTPQNVLDRDALWRSNSGHDYARIMPLSDPAYDVSVTGTQSSIFPAVAALPNISSGRVALSLRGSNSWASGGARTLTGRTLIANDPHLELGIPGVFYAVEMHAGRLHVAGVTVPGIPGVVLGHNERIAWATTNAMASTLSVFESGTLSPDNWHNETFHVRFSPDVRARYYRTRREFALRDPRSGKLMLVRWGPFSENSSALETVFDLDSADGLDAALHALARYSGPPQNFVLGGAGGRVAYHLAGRIPRDPAWGRYVHAASELPARYAPVPYDRLPAVAPSRTATIVSANNKMYGARYAYRLSPMFAPPYRAYRIARLLHVRARYDVAYFTRMQMDAVSPADADLAHGLARYANAHPGTLPAVQIAELARWNGDFSAGSNLAGLEHELRARLQDVATSPYDVFLAFRTQRPPPALADAIRDPSISQTRYADWGQAGAVAMMHPFGPIGFPFLNGALLPGDGDEYTIHVQTPELAQSFRAVWEVGNWERGGLSLPGGESGEIGSPHYDDMSRAWIAGRLEPLPFSDRAVLRAAKQVLLLEQ
jgi:penicillin amidase